MRLSKGQQDMVLLKSENQIIPFSLSKVHFMHVDLKIPFKDYVSPHRTSIAKDQRDGWRLSKQMVRNITTGRITPYRGTAIRF